MPQISIKITGLRQMINKYRQAPKILDEEIRTALDQSIKLIQRNVRLRTPVDTNILRASIGGVKGWKQIGQRIAGIGTNVKYAFWVEVKPARHAVGMVGYFRKGVEASMSGINKLFEKAMKRLAQRLTK